MRRSNTTLLIFLCTLTLMTIGIVMVYSSSAAIAARDTMSASLKLAQTVGGISPGDISAHSDYYLRRQVIWAAISVVAMLIAFKIDYDRYTKFAPWLLGLSFLLLLAVFVPGVGIEVNGSKRWVGAGAFRLQPSELAKLALIIFMARKLADRQEQLKSLLFGFFPALAVLALFLAVIVIEPDLGATVVIGAIMFTMWLVAGMRIAHLVSLGVAAIPCIVIAIIVEPYRVARFLSFMDPEKDIRGKGWQLHQSLVTIGSGGVTGLGLGEGPQKYLFLSEAHTDFIFAGICEELGMVGAMIVVALYAFFIIQGLRVATRVPDMYGSLLAAGVTSMIGIQAFINMMVVTGLLPTKGLTLPLISYGGSSLLINMIGIGILLNVSRGAEISQTTSRTSVHAYV